MYSVSIRYPTIHEPVVLKFEPMGSKRFSFVRPGVWVAAAGTPDADRDERSRGIWEAKATTGDHDVDER